MSLIDQIMNGRPGEQELRASFRKNPIRKPLAEEACDHVRDGNVTRIVRPEVKRPQGWVDADGYAHFDVFI